MRALITGGAGFIGSHVVDALVDEGHDVSVIDNLSTGLRENLNPRVKFYKIDIRDKVELKRVFGKDRPEVVFHLAANANVRRSLEDPVYDAENNILGSLNLLRFAQDYGVKKFIFSSTGGAMYGEAERIPTPESYFPDPISPYGLAKLSVEQYLDVWHRLYGLDYAALRYSNVYGPRQNAKGEAGVIAIFTSKMIKDDLVTINGSGKQTRDYIYVSDVVRANLQVLESGVSGTYNIGVGIETSVNEIYDKLGSLLGVETLDVRNPPIKGELLRSALDCGKAKKFLDWEPQVSLEEGLEKTLDFFRGKLNA